MEIHMRHTWIGLFAVVIAFTSALGFGRAPDKTRDRADIERVFNKYLQSLNGADVALASEVWLQSPDVLVVTPVGRFTGWDGVKEIFARTKKEFSEWNVQADHVSIVVAGDAAWLVYDYVFTARLADGRPFTAKGWESHGYLRTSRGWRIAHLHYSVPPPPPA
jgi:ketosteroid isomerase-like protein